MNAQWTVVATARAAEPAFSGLGQVGKMEVPPLSVELTVPGPWGVGPRIPGLWPSPQPLPPAARGLPLSPSVSPPRVSYEDTCQGCRATPASPSPPSSPPRLVLIPSPFRGARAQCPLLHPPHWPSEGKDAPGVTGPRQLRGLGTSHTCHLVRPPPQTLSRCPMLWACPPGLEASGILVSLLS